MALVLARIQRDDGEEFLLNSGAWKITSDGLQGIDAPAFSVYSEKNGVGDGAFFAGKRVDDREIQITCRNINPKNNPQARAAALSFFNPKKSFKIYITYQGTTRWTEGELEAISLPSENIHRPMTLTVKFYCASGYLKSVDDFGKDIASVSAGFGFPFIDVKNPRIPVYTGFYNYDKQVAVSNDGDVPTYPRVTIQFTGNVSNPRIYKDDAFVRILGDFVNGDTVNIDLENCTIYKNGVNWIQHIDRQSTFTDMILDTGGAVFGFSADDGDTNMAVFLYYNKLYIGL